MILKLLIVATVIISGFVLIYPEEIIQFSKGSTIQENTEKNIMEIKDGAEKETENIKQIFYEFGEKTKNSFNSFFEYFANFLKS